MINLVFETLALAVGASILIFFNMKKKDNTLNENKANPKELEDGRYAIKKPEQKYMAGVENYTEEEIKEN